MTARRNLVIMVKEPRPGRVKTRLARDVGSIAATWWFRHQITRLLRRIEDPRWQVSLAVSPDIALTGRAWPQRFVRLPQGQGDLGDRMTRLMRSLPGGPVCIIGADIPGITRSHIWRAFQALGGQDAVFGPAPDGGFWLVGVSPRRALPPGFMKAVRWSGPHALKDTINTLGSARYALCDTLRDVDEACDLEQLL